MMQMSALGALFFFDDLSVTIGISAQWRLLLDVRFSWGAHVRNGQPVRP